MTSFADIRAGIAGKRTSHAPDDLGLQRGRPVEQRTYEGDPEFAGGGRHAEQIPNDGTSEFWDLANDPGSGYYGNLRRTARQNRENIGDNRSAYPLRRNHGENT